MVDLNTQFSISFPQNVKFFQILFSDLSSNHLESIGGDMFIESPFLSSIDLSSNTSLFSICRSSFVRHEFLQTGKVQNCDPVELEVVRVYIEMVKSLNFDSES